MFIKVVEQRPWDAPALANLRVLLLRRGAVDDAIVLLERSIDAKATPPAAFTHLGLAYERTGRIEDARRMFTEALRLNGEDAEAKKGMERLQ